MEVIEQGIKIVFDELTPSNVLSMNLDGIIPFQLFEITRTSSGRIDSWKSINDLMLTDEEKVEKENNHRGTYLSVCKLIKSVNGEVIDFTEESMPVLTFFTDVVIKNSSRLFNQRTTINRNNLIILDMVAQRYGCLPSDVLGNRNMKDLDKWAINSLSCHVGIEEEYKRQKSKV